MISAKIQKAILMVVAKPPLYGGHAASKKWADPSILQIKSKTKFPGR
jgi:hypothetical protein